MSWISGFDLLCLVGLVVAIICLSTGYVALGSISVATFVGFSLADHRGRRALPPPSGGLDPSGDREPRQPMPPTRTGSATVNRPQS